MRYGPVPDRTLRPLGGVLRSAFPAPKAIHFTEGRVPLGSLPAGNGVSCWNVRTSDHQPIGVVRHPARRGRDAHARPCFPEETRCKLRMGWALPFGSAPPESVLFPVCNSKRMRRLLPRQQPCRSAAPGGTTVGEGTSRGTLGPASLERQPGGPVSADRKGSRCALSPRCAERATG